ncbi:UDP-D-galactose:(glucosyl)lipopolysaccharide-1,6-D-galactosyltransferase [Serratia fonticola]|uniref:UDP-D-galactose:(Glucosyl)lipopolysaccharide-1,6-D-galactosyltransferase n=1 Tax=Serratia fonticola TaxID=47917 RepID=A0A4U9TGD5_SERFO|nr:UDP-D-galactose:(glucosyl)lipopolysaccharide-1,6-D-galactosyltransferase [Serratia fonticola]
MRTPVITSTTCGGAEFITPGQNGFVCDALDVSALHRCYRCTATASLGFEHGRGGAPIYFTSHSSPSVSTIDRSLPEVTAGMKQHILFIIDGLPGGGAENVTLALAKGISKRGYHVTLFSLSKRRDYEIPVGIDYVVDHDNNQGPLRKFTELSRRAASLDQQLSILFTKAGLPILVISNLHKTDRIVVRSKMLQSCNVWHCVHGMLSRSYLGNKTGLRRFIKQRKMQRVYKNRQIIAVSDAVGSDLVRKLGIKPAQLVTIYNPFDISEIVQHANKDNPFAGEDYILHVGRFHQVKRHDRLLEAFAIAKLPCKLVLVGQGEEEIKMAIQQKITTLNLQDKVILAGFYQNPLPIIKEARIVALSSDSEGFAHGVD